VKEEMAAAARRKVESTPRPAEFSGWREWFHAAAVNGRRTELDFGGGETSL